MKRALLAASAIVFSTLTPATLPVLVGTASAEPTQQQLDAHCNTTFPPSSYLPGGPNTQWHWSGLITSSSTSGQSGTPTGAYRYNAANRVIQAEVLISGGTTIYNVTCRAMNPSPNDIDVAPHNETTTFTENNSTTTTDWAAVCVPSSTNRSPGVPTSWFTPPGNQSLLGANTCTGLAASLSLN